MQSAHYQFDQFQNIPPIYLQGAYTSQLSGDSPSSHLVSPNLNYLGDQAQYEMQHSARENYILQQQRSLQGIKNQDGISHSSSHHSSIQHQQSQRSSYPSDHLEEQRSVFARLQEERKKLLFQQPQNSAQDSVARGSQSIQTAGFGGAGLQTLDQNVNSHYPNLDEQTARKEMVKRMLNQRKLNRSGQVSQYSEKEMEEEMIQRMSQHAPSVTHINNLGGYHPDVLYQDEVIQEHSQQQRSNSNENRSQLNQCSANKQQHSLTNSHTSYSRVSHPQPSLQQRAQTNQSQISNGLGQGKENGDEIEDKKYRDAVAYARAEIERDRQIRLQQLYQDSKWGIAHQSSQVLDQSSHRQSYSGRNEASNESAQGNKNASGNKIQQMERYLQQNSQEKIHQQMNNNTKHHFTYDSDEGGNGEAASREETSHLRVKKSRNAHKSSVEEKGFRSTGLPKSKLTGDYMKPTVNADLRKDKPQTTIAKTKQLVTEHQKKFNQQHTFKPQIKEYPQAKELSKEERWKKLTEPKTAQIQQRERIRAQIEVEETQKNCTFKPTLNQTMSNTAGYISNISGHNSAGYASMDVAERLLHEADLRKEKREKLKREHELQQMKDCSFKPKILSSFSSNSQSTLAVVNLEKLQVRDPIHQRVGELQKEKNEKLQKLRIDSEKEQQESYTFQPQLNKKSQKIAVVKQVSENKNSVVDRLYQDANERIEKQMSHNVSMNDQLNRDYSFHPQISKTSAYLSAHNENFSGNLKDFHSRQEEYIRRQQEKKAEARKKWADEERFSFKPEINATSEVIVESDPTRSQETEQERLDRLYHRDQKKQEVVKEMVEREVYGQFTFKPEINKVSKAIARNVGSIDELAYNPSGKEKRQQLQEQLMTQEFSDCTFRPQTTKSRKYQNVTSVYSMADCSSTEEYSMRLKEKLKQKQERIAQERREREYQQLKDCTFKPSINEHDPKSTILSSGNESVASIKGIQRHLELKELKKKQEEERRLREAEVFGLNHKFAVRADDLDLSRLPPSKIPQAQSIQHQTVPEPFELTKTAEHRKQQVAREIKEREMQECTFKPKTNEGRNKQIIQQLMRQENLVQLQQHQSRESLGHKNQRTESNDDKENYYNYPQQMVNANNNNRTDNY